MTTDNGPVRTATILFTDLVGSTELFSRVGEEAAERLRTRHFGVLRGVIAGHGGREVKNLGDGLMAVFESACDGLSAGVALQRAIEDDARRRGGDAMTIRVGVSTGDLIESDGDFFGSGVVEASRLCAAASAGQVLATDVTRAVAGGRGGHVLRPVGELDLKGLPAPVTTWEVEWAPDSSRTLRAVLADDAILVREGVARLLEEQGIEVIAQASDADELIECVETARPDIAITDVRMPPTNTVEGIEAAERIRDEHPGVAVLVLSQHLETRYARRLLETGSGGIGYLLKERVTDVEEFASLVRRVAAGETVIDPGIADRLAAQAAS